MKNRKDIQNVTSSQDSRVSISQKSIEIRHEGKPIRGAALTGHVYLLVDLLVLLD